MDIDKYFPGLNSHKLTEGIYWYFYKHWGQGVWAGEGKERVNGDGSGCRKLVGGLWMTGVPCVVQARLYASHKGEISAVYSYPNGIGAVDEYFWEIYDGKLCPDPERYTTENSMERRIMELLA